MPITAHGTKEELIPLYEQVERYGDVTWIPADKKGLFYVGIPKDEFDAIEKKYNDFVYGKK